MPHHQPNTASNDTPPTTTTPTNQDPKAQLDTPETNLDSTPTHHHEEEAEVDYRYPSPQRAALLQKFMDLLDVEFLSEDLAVVLRLCHVDRLRGFVRDLESTESMEERYTIAHFLDGVACRRCDAFRKGLAYEEECAGSSEDVRGKRKDMGTQTVKLGLFVDGNDAVRCQA